MKVIFIRFKEETLQDFFTEMSLELPALLDMDSQHFPPADKGLVLG